MGKLAICMAVFADSGSLISPMNTTFGSSLMSDFKTAAKLRPSFSLTLIWVAPSRKYSTGSSTV